MAVYSSNKTLRGFKFCPWRVARPDLAARPTKSASSKTTSKRAKRTQLLMVSWRKSTTKQLVRWLRPAHHGISWNITQGRDIVHQEFWWDVIRRSQVRFHRRAFLGEPLSLAMLRRSVVSSSLSRTWWASRKHGGAWRWCSAKHWNSQGFPVAWHRFIVDPIRSLAILAFPSSAGSFISIS